MVEEKAKHAIEHDQLNEKHKSVVNNLEKSLTLENKRLAGNILTEKRKREQNLELEVGELNEVNENNEKLKEQGLRRTRNLRQ